MTNQSGEAINTITQTYYVTYIHKSRPYSAILEAIPGKRAEGVLQTLRGDGDQGITSSDEVRISPWVP